MRKLISFTAIFLSALLLISGSGRKQAVSPASAGSREPTPPSASTTEPTQERIDNDAIVRKAIADQLNKKPDELTEEDYKKITQLFLYDTDVSDITLIKELTGLQRLRLDGTKVSDLTPIKELNNLQILNLVGTQVSDLTPLKPLIWLETLYLSPSAVTNEQVAELRKALPKLMIRR